MSKSFGSQTDRAHFPLKIMIAVRDRSAILLSLFVPAGSIRLAWKKAERPQNQALVQVNRAARTTSK